MHRPCQAHVVSVAATGRVPANRLHFVRNGNRTPKIEHTSNKQRDRKRLTTTLLTTSLVTLVIVLLLGGGLIRGEAESRRGIAARDGAIYAQRVGHRLHEWMGATYVLAALVQRDKGRVVDFETDAAKIHELFPMITALQLAPAGVIEHIYPLPGNEIVLGTNLLSSRDRRFEAHLAMSKGQLVVSGPYTLAQGGIGAIGRYPIFMADANGWQKFWGFAIVVVRIPNLLEVVRIADLAEDGYRFELCRILEDGSCEVFSRRGEGRPVAPVIIDIPIQNGQWQLHLSPEDGWYPMRLWLAIMISAVVLAVLSALVQHLLIRRAIR